MIGRWPLALCGSVAAHATFFGAVLAAWPAVPIAEEAAASVVVLDDEPPNVTIEAEISQGESSAPGVGEGANNHVTSGEATGTADALPPEVVAAAAETAQSAARARKAPKHDIASVEAQKQSKRHPRQASEETKASEKQMEKAVKKTSLPGEAPSPSARIAAPSKSTPAAVPPELPPPTVDAAAPSAAVAKPPPPAAEVREDAKKGKEEHAAAGSGAGASTTFKFARTTATGGGDSVADAQYIGDHDAAAPTNLRVATTTERSSGNARGSGDALPVPEGHANDASGPLAHTAVAAPSPEARPGDRTTAGRAEGAAPASAPVATRRRLFMLGEVSDAQIAAQREATLPQKTLFIHRKHSPAAKVTVLVAPELPPAAPLASPTPLTAEALLSEPLTAVTPAPEPVAAEDGFWAGEGESTSGSGTDAADSPDPMAGEDVQRTIFKRDGAGWTEVTTLEDAVQLGDHAAVSVRQTELGTWFTPVDDLVRLGWRPPLDQLVLGVGGRVTVEFTVRRNGRVEQVKLVDANVPLTLQEAALAAVPDAVASPPNGYAPLRVRYVFRYGTSGGKLN